MPTLVRPLYRWQSDLRQMDGLYCIGYRLLCGVNALAYYYKSNVIL